MRAAHSDSDVPEVILLNRQRGGDLFRLLVPASARVYCSARGRPCPYPVSREGTAGPTHRLPLQHGISLLIWRIRLWARLTRIACRQSVSRDGISSRIRGPGSSYLLNFYLRPRSTASTPWLRRCDSRDKFIVFRFHYGPFRFRSVNLPPASSLNNLI